MARSFIVALVLVLAAAGCGSDDNDSSSEPDAGATSSSAAPTTSAVATTTVAATTTTAAGLEVDPVSFQSAGPYEVGVTTLALPTGNLVEVYCPATDAAAGATDAYQVRDYLPEALAGIIPAETPDSYEIAAARDGEPSADGPFPLVLFSHGAASFRTQSSELNRHLASWGMVVASPDHPSRNLTSALSNSDVEPQASADDLRATRELVTGADAGVATGLADPTLVITAGHSAGGGTALAVAGDEGVLGYISYAWGARDDTPMPPVPSLFMAGALDEIVEPDRTTSAHAAATPPSWLWVIDGAGHLAFSDLCAIGEGRGGLIGLAEAAGISAAVPDDLRRLATDGCEPPNLPVEQVWPAVHQASVAFARFAFGFDDTPEGSGVDDIDLAGVDITIESSTTG